MPVSPNGFAKAKIEYSDLTALSLLKEDNYVDYAQTYPDLAGASYIMAAEAQPGVLQRSGTKLYKSWKKEDKPLNAFRVTADVSGAAGSVITATIVADDHLGGGTMSPPAVGLVFEDNSTGIHYEVRAVTKTTAGAHTVQLAVATDSTTAPELTAANSYLMSLGRPSVQEDSFQQDGEYQGWGSVERDHTAIRVNKKYTDLASFEELAIDGRTYRVHDMPSLDEQFWNYQELRLMFGPKYANMGADGNQNSDFEGIIPIVQNEGTTVTPPSGALTDTFFENIRRNISANGFGKGFDVLVDTEAAIAFQNYFSNKTGTNGAVIYGNLQDGDVRLNFDFGNSFTYYGVNFAMKDYTYFNRARTHGADMGTGIWAGSMLFVPNSIQAVGNSGERVRSFSIKYMSTSPVGGVVHTGSDGMLLGKNTNMNAEFAHVTWKSVDIAAPKEFIYAKLAV